MLETPYPLWNDAPQPALVASRHRTSGEIAFPAIDASSPLKAGFDNVPVAEIGVAYSFTIIHPSAKSGEAPYALGFVDFPGPVRIFGRLTGKARPVIGERYAARKDDKFGYVFVAVDA